MEKIEINYSIPDQKSDITLETWLKFEKIATQEDIDPDFLQKKMLEIFCDLKYEVSSKMKQVEIDEILGYLNKVLGTKSELHQTFDFEGKKYGLIPDFDKNITAGELIDLDKYLEIKDYPRLLSILYRPITKEEAGLYQIEPYSATHTNFLNIRYDIFEGVIGFFFLLYRDCIAASLRCIPQLMKKMKVQDLALTEKVNSLLNGVDIPNFYSFFPMAMSSK
ncbi:hypothetical protein ACFPVY_04005 [Flavobacterium qiangtangense]|uniref:Uncharacterized protein n=1 Tax=Flavobacterium qiangtangense TaxID=1442595 RepID=A0ABW1PJJ3_9FLAO